MEGKARRGMEIVRWGILLWMLGGLARLRSVKAQAVEVGEECPGEELHQKVWYETPRLVERDRKGEKYEVGAADDALKILHVYGSPFELGRAHGALLREEIQSTYGQLFRRMEDEWIKDLYMSFLPDFLARTIARIALNAALDATYLLTLNYLPTRFVDEMLGLSQGADVSFQDVARIQMVPELFQSTCSMLGSWGPGSMLSSGGGLFQMRALDWDLFSAVLGYQTVIYFHPSDGHSFATFTWAGFIGCFSGYSGRLGISEKAWSGSNLSDRHVGMPWHFVLRDVLQFTTNLEGAWDLLMEQTRTCPILVGIGSAQDQRFVLLGYSVDSLELYDETNFTLITSGTQDGNELPGVIFVDKNPQPSEDECMGSLVQTYYGRLDERALMDMVCRQQTGAMHTAVYDFADNSVYFSWGAIDNATGDVIPAYNRNFVKLNMSSLLYPSPPCPLSSQHGENFDYCMRWGD